MCEWERGDGGAGMGGRWGREGWDGSMCARVCVRRVRERVGREYRAPVAALCTACQLAALGRESVYAPVGCESRAIPL